MGTNLHVAASDSTAALTGPPPLNAQDNKIFEESINLIHKSNGNRKMLSEAYEMIVDLASRNPQSGYPHAALAELHYLLSIHGSSTLSEAMKSAQTALNMDPDVAAAHVVVAKVLIKNGNVHQAGFSARKAISLSPGNPDAMYVMARVAELSGQYEESENWYRKCLEAHTDKIRRSNIYFWLGKMLAEKKPADIKGATDAYAQAAELGFDTNIWALNEAGRFLINNTDEYDQAIIYLEQSLSIGNSRSARLNLALAEYYKWADAKQHPQKYGANSPKPLNPEEIRAKTGVNPDYAFVESPLSKNKSFVSIALWEGGYIENVDIVPKASDGTALISAAYGNDLELVKLLINNGANVNAKDTDQHATAIFYATRNQNLEMVKILVDKGARINLRDNTGTTLAEYAVNRESGDRISIITYLLEQGIDPDIPNGYGEPLIFATLFSGNLEAFRLLVTKYDANVDSMRNDNNSLVAFAAASSGTVGQEMLKILLKEGANPWVKYDITDIVNYLNAPYHNPIQFPAFKGNAELISEARKTFPKPPGYDPNKP